MSNTAQHQLSWIVGRLLNQAGTLFAISTVLESLEFLPEATPPSGPPREALLPSTTTKQLCPLDPTLLCVCSWLTLLLQHLWMPVVP